MDALCCLDRLVALLCMPVDLPTHSLHLLRERDLHLLRYPLVLVQQPLDLPQPARLALLLHLLEQQLVLAAHLL